MKGMKEIVESNISFFYSVVSGDSPQSFRERDGVFSMCGVFVDD